MRRVVSVWFPTPLNELSEQLEEGQGPALKPQRGLAPFDPDGSEGQGPFREQATKTPDDLGSRSCISR